MSLAAEPGFPRRPASLGLLFAGIAVFAAVGALSHEHERAFSASLIYLGWAWPPLSASTPSTSLDPTPSRTPTLVERLAELALIVALFTTGLKLDVARRRAWTPLGRLLLGAMPLTIAAVAAFGTGVMGLSLAAALALGAALAPTDPVLAGRPRGGTAGGRGGARPELRPDRRGRAERRPRVPVHPPRRLRRAGGRHGWVAEWALVSALRRRGRAPRRRGLWATGSPGWPSACATASCSPTSSTAGWPSARSW